MNAYLSFFRFLIRFSLPEAIFLSTLALSTPASFFARSSKAFQPFGFLFAAMLVIPLLFTSVAIGRTIPFAVIVDGAACVNDSTAAYRKAAGTTMRARRLVGVCHLLDPHEARVLHASKPVQ